MKSRVKTYQSFNLANRLLPYSQIRNNNLLNTTTECVITTKNDTSDCAHSSENSSANIIMSRASLPYVCGSANKTQNHNTSLQVSPSGAKYISIRQLAGNKQVRSPEFQTKQIIQRGSPVGSANIINSNGVKIKSALSSQGSGLINQLTAKSQISYIKSGSSGLIISQQKLSNSGFINTNGEGAGKEAQENKKQGAVVIQTSIHNNISNTNSIPSPSMSAVLTTQQNKKFLQPQKQSTVQASMNILSGNTINANYISSNSSNMITNRIGGNQREISKDDVAQQLKKQSNSSYIYIKPSNRYNNNLSSNNQNSSHNHSFVVNYSSNSGMTKNIINKNNSYSYNNANSIQTSLNQPKNTWGIHKPNQQQQNSANTDKIQINIRKNSSKILMYPQTVIRPDSSETNNNINTHLSAHVNSNNLSVLTTSGKLNNSEVQTYISINKNKSKVKSKNKNSLQKRKISFQNQNLSKKDKECQFKNIMNAQSVIGKNQNICYQVGKKQLQQVKYLNGMKTSQQLNLLNDLTQKNHLLTFKIETLQSQLQILKNRLKQLSQTQNHYKQQIQNKNLQIKKIRNENRIELQQIRIMAIKQQKQQEKQLFIKAKQQEQQELLKAALRSSKQKQMQLCQQIQNLRQQYQRKMSQLRKNTYRPQGLQITQRMKQQYSQIQQKFKKIQATHYNLELNYASTKKDKQQLAQKYRNIQINYLNLKVQNENMLTILRQNKQKQSQLISQNKQLEQKIYALQIQFSKLSQRHIDIESCLKLKQIELTQQMNNKFTIKENKIRQQTKIALSSMGGLFQNLSNKYQCKIQQYQQKLTRICNIMSNFAAGNIKKKINQQQIFNSTLLKILSKLRNIYQQSAHTVNKQTKNRNIEISLEIMQNHSSHDRKKLISSIDLLINIIKQENQSRNRSSSNSPDKKQIKNNYSKSKPYINPKHQRHSSNHSNPASCGAEQRKQQNQSLTETKQGVDIQCFQNLQNQYNKLAQSMKKCQQECQKLYKNFIAANQALAKCQQQNFTKSKIHQQKEKCLQEQMSKYEASHYSITQQLITLRAKILNLKYKHSNQVQQNEIKPHSQTLTLNVVRD